MKALKMRKSRQALTEGTPGRQTPQLKLAVDNRRLEIAVRSIAKSEIESLTDNLRLNVRVFALFPALTILFLSFSFFSFLSGNGSTGLMSLGPALASLVAFVGFYSRTRRD